MQDHEDHKQVTGVCSDKKKTVTFKLSIIVSLDKILHMTLVSWRKHNIHNNR